MVHLITIPRLCPLRITLGEVMSRVNGKELYHPPVTVTPILERIRGKAYLKGGCS
jgi:hypothetical protein